MRITPYLLAGSLEGTKLFFLHALKRVIRCFPFRNAITVGAVLQGHKPLALRRVKQAPFWATTSKCGVTVTRANTTRDIVQVFYWLRLWLFMGKLHDFETHRKIDGGSTQR